MSSGNFSHFKLIISNVSSTYGALKFGHSATDTVECHYNVSHIIAGTEAEYHRLKSQKTPHTSPYQMSYGLSFVIILQKIDHVIKAPHCIIVPNRTNPSAGTMLMVVLAMFHSMFLLFKSCYMDKMLSFKIANYFLHYIAKLRELKSHPWPT